MEPNKLETDFRQKINDRTLTPSENSWDRLDAMLTIAEQKKPKRKNLWLYVAASFIGLFFTGTLMYNSSKTILETPKVVLENSKTPKSTVKSSQVEVVILDTVSNKKQIILQPLKYKQSIQKNYSRVSVIKINPNQVVENATKNEQESNPILPVQVMQESKLQKTIPSYVNVDELLVSVEKTSKIEKSTIQKQVVKVDAKSLLSQVDGELELTFREKVIQTVNKNYQTVKVALENRNNQ
jgi:hypothetical protein